MNISDKISFILDNQVVTLDFSKNQNYTPTTTVLQYLRSLPNHKGVKEGCAEGDCGACTVAVADEIDDKLQYATYDSCLLFLPMLHGKQLITVENLGSFKQMHPVQQIMVDLDGSQCGYCTPGIIMSLFVLYKNTQNPTYEEVTDALTGNLCRCTGYRPIIDAAMQVCVNNGVDQFTEHESEIAKQLSNLKTYSLSISTEDQKYFQPKSLPEALEIREKFPQAIIINGATDIALRVTKKHELLSEILDLSQVSELKYITESEASFVFGTGVKLESIKNSTSEHYTALHKMLKVFGSRQIRSLATLGGNIGSASPIGDTLPVLMAYDSSVILKSKNSERKIKLNEFIVGYRKTQCNDNELIVAVEIPKENNNYLIKSYKISKRTDLDISTVSAGFALKLAQNAVIEDIKLFYGGMAERTKPAAKAQQFLKGKEWNRQNVDEAMLLIDSEFTPLSDARCGADARKIMAKNLLLKFWSETV